MNEVCLVFYPAREVSTRKVDSCFAKKFAPYGESATFNQTNAKLCLETSGNVTSIGFDKVKDHLINMF